MYYVYVMPRPITQCGEQRRSGRETTADVRLGGTRRASRRPLHCGHVAQAGDLELRRRYCVIRTVRRASVELRYSDPSGISV